MVVAIPDLREELYTTVTKMDNQEFQNQELMLLFLLVIITGNLGDTIIDVLDTADETAVKVAATDIDIV